MKLWKLCGPALRNTPRASYLPASDRLLEVILGDFKLTLAFSLSLSLPVVSPASCKRHCRIWHRSVRWLSKSQRMEAERVQHWSQLWPAGSRAKGSTESSKQRWTGRTKTTTSGILDQFTKVKSHAPWPECRALVQKCFSSILCLVCLSVCRRRRRRRMVVDYDLHLFVK